MQREIWCRRLLFLFRVVGPFALGWASPTLGTSQNHKPSQKPKPETQSYPQIRNFETLAEIVPEWLGGRFWHSVPCGRERRDSDNGGDGDGGAGGAQGHDHDEHEGSCVKTSMGT